MCVSRKFQEKILFAKHRAVILFGIFHQASVLFREEESIPRDATIAPGQICRAVSHLHPLADRFLFATLAEAEARRVPVGLGVLAKVFEAA